MLADEPDIALLLVDINMPVMDGLTLLAELRAPVDRADCDRLGLWRYHGQHTHRDEPRWPLISWTKPVDLTDLELTIDEDPGKHCARTRPRPPARRRRSEPAPTSRVIFRRTWSRCLPTATSRWARCGARPVAVLFVDIVGFTGMAENMPPESVVTLLREFHERMAAHDLRLQRRHDVEKYIGDEIFAVFGLLPSGGQRRRQRLLRCRQSRMLAALGRLERRARRTRGAGAVDRHWTNYGPAVMGDGRQRPGSLLHRDRRQRRQHRERPPTGTQRAISRRAAGGGRRDRIQHRRRAIAGTADALLASLLDQGEQALEGRCSGAVRI